MIGHTAASATATSASWRTPGRRFPTRPKRAKSAATKASGPLSKWGPRPRMRPSRSGIAWASNGWRARAGVVCPVWRVRMHSVPRGRSVDITREPRAGSFVFSFLIAPLFASALPSFGVVNNTLGSFDETNRVLFEDQGLFNNMSPPKRIT